MFNIGFDVFYVYKVLKNKHINKKTSYNTLCNQAQLVISNKMVELKNEIAKLADEMATLANPENMAKEFFASEGPQGQVPLTLNA